MSYPQPNSNSPVLLGQGFFRLTTPLISQGDIYESQQGAMAFAVGPNSDISQVGLSYFDDTVPNTFMGQAQITPERLFSGAVYARNEPNALYQPSGRQGRILIYPTDIWDPNYIPAGFGIGDLLFLTAPVLDVIQYFSAPPDVAPQRSDRSIQMQEVAIGAGTTYMVFPYYGRGYAYLSFGNHSGGAITWGAFGINFTFENASDPATPVAQQKQIRAPAAVADGATADQVVKSSSDGVFDALLLTFAGTTGAPVSLKLIMSDIPR